MVKYAEIQVPNTAGNSEPAGAPVHDKEPLYGPLAVRAQSHIGGIGLGLVGLLVGSLMASPLLAAAGLLGGFAAGRALLDKNEGRSTAISQEAVALQNQHHAPDNGPARMPYTDSAVHEDPTAGRAEQVDLAATGVRLDTSFSQMESDVTPTPTGKRSVRNTQLS